MVGAGSLPLNKIVSLCRIATYTCHTFLRILTPTCSVYVHLQCMYMYVVIHVHVIVSPYTCMHALACTGV